MATVSEVTRQGLADEPGSSGYQYLHSVRILCTMLMAFTVRQAIAQSPQRPEPALRAAHAEARHCHAAGVTMSARAPSHPGTCSWPCSSISARRASAQKDDPPTDAKLLATCTAQPNSLNMLMLRRLNLSIDDGVVATSSTLVRAMFEMTGPLRRPRSSGPAAVGRRRAAASTRCLFLTEAAGDLTLPVPQELHPPRHTCHLRNCMTDTATDA